MAPEALNSSTTSSSPGSIYSRNSVTSSPEQSLPSPPDLIQHHDPETFILNGSARLKSQMLSRSAQNNKPASTSRLPLKFGGQQRLNAPRINPGVNRDILSRMVTASGTGTSSLPIRVASMQDFRRSTNPLNTVPELSRQQPSRGRGATNQTFALNGHRNSPLATNRPMSSDNPLLKMMEQRMAARNSSMGASSVMKIHPLPTIASSPSPPLPKMSSDDKAALQASINKWSGASQSAPADQFDEEEKSQSQETERRVSNNDSSPRQIAHGSPSVRVPLSNKQVELLHELTTSQIRQPEEQPSQEEIFQELLRQQSGGMPQNFNNLPQANGAGHYLMSNLQQPAPHTSNARPSLTRCAVSSAEVDRLRKENQSIQLMKEWAIHDRMLKEQAYLHQRRLAASALVSLQSKEEWQQTDLQGQLNQFQLNALSQLKKLSSTKTNSLLGMNSSRTSTSFRKRRSVRQDEDDETVSSGNSRSTHTHSITSASSSHKIHRSLSHCSARATITGSMESLGLKSQASLLSGSNRNESFSSGLHARNSNSSGSSMENQTFSSSNCSDASGQPASPNTTLNRSASSSNWIKSLLSEQKSAGDAAATFQLAVKHSNNSLVSLSHSSQPPPALKMKHSNNSLVSLPHNLQATPTPKVKRSNNSLVSLPHNLQPPPALKNPEEVIATKPIQVQAEEFAPPVIERPPSTSNEKIIISAVPDRIKFQNAKPDTKPLDVVKEALSSRGVKCDTKPSMNMGDGFFDKITEMYDQEIVNAIRSNDMESLKQLHAKGTNLECGNRFGETLIHLACRRSHRDLVSFLVNEVGVSLRVRDDFGRTPWHDACWRTEPNLDLLDMLLNKAPELLMLSDKRGHTPLDYARREHWSVLVPFLLERTDKFRSV